MQNKEYTVMEILQATMHTFSTGMYIRVPVESRPEDQDYREYRIGQIVSIDSDTEVATVRLEVHKPYEPCALISHELALSKVERCHLAPDSSFSHISTKERGRILM